MKTLGRSQEMELFPPCFKEDSAHNVPKASCSLPPVASSFTQFHTDISFLFPCLTDIHSIAVVGSAAHGSQTEGSDLDFVVIAKNDCLENVCKAVFENDIEMTLAESQGTKVEVTVLTTIQAEELFSVASPFAFAIRHGTVLFDDGYLDFLLAKPNPQVPTREYYLKSLFESVACQYFGVVKQLEETVRQRECNPACCSNEHADCRLLASEMLPKLIFRMLYLTLPCRGLMPLSKDDVILYAETFYPSDIASAVKKAASLLRSRNTAMSFPVYRSMKSASAKLFREVLGILGYQEDVRQIIQDAVKSVRGNIGGIENTLLKKCLT